MRTRHIAVLIKIGARLKPRHFLAGTVRREESARESLLSVTSCVLLGALAVGRTYCAEQPNSPAHFTSGQVEFYEQKVLPILSENCYKCHSHGADKIKGGFVLDSREGLLKGGDTGPAVIPGQPEKSLLIKAVRHVDEDLQMPPKSKLTDPQIAALEEWIKMGVPYSDRAISLAKPKSRTITSVDRAWWSFQPVKNPPVPAVKDNGWSRNPIDQFVFAKLDEVGLSPAPEAERPALIRRAYFDTIGLPPEASEVERFVADASPKAYENMVETLLSSPRYGEKWARHWLDLVRYAESDGYKSDSFRPTAWRYRDYVIRSFNLDKPFNRFLMEQVAADELWPDDPESLIGVSYLRLGIYEYNQRNVKGQWATILNDITDVTGDAFMGLGMQCARCHDHKFDPILRRDYYRLQAFFAALSPRDNLPLASRGEVKDYQARLAVWDIQTADIRTQIAELERPAREKTKKAVIDKLPKEIQAIMAKPAAERTPYEQQINDLAYRQVTEEDDKLDGKIKGADREKLEILRGELAKFDSIKPRNLPEAMLATDIGQAAPPISIPSDKSQTAIEPGFLTLFDEAPATIQKVEGSPASTGRRAALAAWLGKNDNPLTPRVIVNRIWQRNFGRGLSGTPNDFGHLGEIPSHPELLDWLSTYLVQHDWSVKAIHRLILNSATYRQSSSPAEFAAKVAVDPENRLLWRQAVRRLEGDQIRDSMLWASGELDLQAGGPSVEAAKPRRTVYTKWLRNSRDPLLEAFDPPDAYTSTPQRNVTTTPMQSLVMINGPYVLQRAQSLAIRLKKNPNQDPAALVTEAYRLVYSANPSQEEKANGVEFLARQATRIADSQLNLAQVALAPMPGRSGTAAVFSPDSGQMRLQVPDNHLMPQNDFTIEGFMLLRSSADGEELRTLLSCWDGRKNQPGWALGVAGKKSEHPAQSLVLELIGDTSEDGVGGYEAIGTGLRVELNRPYYFAASMRLEDTSEGGLSIYLKDLSTNAAMQIAHLPHKITATHQSNLPLTIGAQDPEQHLVWDGYIDDVRLCGRALKADELEITRPGTVEGAVGYWRFEEPDPLRDDSSNGHPIRPEVSPSAKSDPMTAALVDFCHALLNSNRFLYLN